MRVTEGEIFDVAVEVRKRSPTFGRHATTTLSAGNRRLLWVPPGFAHGVQTLVDRTAIVYKLTSEFSKEHDRSIRFDDPAIGIRWPIPNPILSPKDRDAPLLKDSDHDFVYAARPLYPN